MYQYILPDSGEGTHESVIMSWAANVGEKVLEDETLLEIESDKAVVELPSPITGYLAKIYVEAGDTGIVGEPIADIVETQEELQAYQSGNSPQASSLADSEKQAESKDEPKDENKEEPSQAIASSGQAIHDQSVDVRQLAVPRVRRYARSKEVDLHLVQGSGNHGKITIEDIDAFLKNGGATKLTIEEPMDATVAQSKESIPEQAEASSNQEKAKPAVASSEEFSEVIEKIPAIRRTIADAMAKSSSEVAQVTVFDQAEVDALVDHRNKMKVIAAERDIKLTFTPYLVKALVAVLKRFPELNVSLDMAKNEISHHQYYNIGVATDTPRGLMVPMIRNAERKSLFDIAKEISEIAEKARDGKIAASDMGKGSISVTNVGAAATAGVWSTPIINLPEIAILNVGRIDKVFVPDQEGNPVLKNMMKISFAFDHRAIDGVYVQKAINLLKAYLSDPDLLLAEG
ncbi:2-oxo acid dehydrogenase subunit E2 [Streptococcus didelphis]|uniref:Dihydrolipoamide acetyltransferase component of pyruvate dehydrogenase complex n=1 Tax=Streptococcus didelphis TaxID=102886 RepID=A0ABY9LIP5_9STRE|nr:dihydrolipoamide acetyltransferase family protein [Streptococcus didelphis]WMB27986.1 2-oxo acid dehydrogenase subunit E2 [Streptococcus didelphis]WMB29548.1 2-oxo acid dehydrogenase subunit E2 [Streptococcus didelphis]